MTKQEVETSFDRMVLDHSGKFWEVEHPEALDQCMDLAFGYCDYLGIPRETIRHAVASQIWSQINDVTLDYFEVIPNTTHGVPHKGDIVIFGGVTGHVSIADGSGDINGFTSFDQNYPTGSSCHIQHHDYKTVLGWLRPKVVNPVVEQDEDEKRSLSTLRSHFVTATDLQNNPFGNLEGYTNTLTQDAYNSWRIPPQIPTTTVSDSFWDSLKRFVGR